jgi:hypothetical protein
MSDQDECWDDIKTSLVNSFDKIIGTGDLESILICFNIHNQGSKIKTSLFDRSNESNWRKWCQGDINGKIDDELFDLLGNKS